MLWLGQARGRISSSASIPHDAHHEKDKYKEFADEDSCSSGTVDMQAMEARQRRVLMAVLAINIATFVMMLPVAIYRILVAAVGQPGQPGRCAHLPSKYRCDRRPHTSQGCLPGRSSSYSRRCGCVALLFRSGMLAQVVGELLEIRRTRYQHTSTCCSSLLADMGTHALGDLDPFAARVQAGRWRRVALSAILGNELCAA